MPEQIMDGRGTGSLLVINPDGSIGISGTVNASVTTSEDSVGENLAPIPASGTYIAGNFNGSLYPHRLEGGSELLVTGSVRIENTVNIIGSTFDLETTPLATNKNNPAWKFEYIVSGTNSGVTGSSIGSITQFIGAGSFVSVFTWSNDLITNIGSYS